jgi:Ran GTPase-activating protein (RanGAP) involved in mRNA processing and transport
MAAHQPAAGPSFIPAPPKLAYINSGLRGARTDSAKRSRPATAGTAAGAKVAAAAAAQKQLAQSPTRPGTATQRSRKTFLQDNEAAQTVLPQPLPPGIPYVAAFTTYDDLIDRRILHQPQNRQVRLSTQDVRLMYDAKCADQGLKPNWAREMRFLELLSSSCRGQQFVLRENGLGAQTADAIAKVLAHSEAFTVLDLSGNRIKDEGAKSIAALFTNNDILVHLGLKSNDIGADGIVALCEALSRSATLTSLDLGGIRGINRNHVGGRGAEALGTLLATNQVLHALDISSNGLGLEGCGLVASGLQHNRALRKLFLASNNIGPDGSRLLASVLQQSHLEVVDLRRNDIGDVGAAHIAAAFQPGSEGGEHIVELHLEDNAIRDVGCRAIATMMRTNQSLKSLHLSHNNLGPGLTTFFEFLRDNRKLREVTLVQCGLQEKEAEVLAKALESGCWLASIDVSRNRMSDVAGTKIFNALAINGKMTSISAAGCSFGNNTAKALANTLRTNTALTSINLRQNMLSGSVGDALLEELKSNPRVRMLDLSYNDIPYLSQSGISAVIQRNNDAWKKGEGRRLESEIEELDFAQRELFQVEEDIVSERRGITEKQDENTRRKETGRGQTENHRRILKELEEKLAAEKAVVAGKQEHFRSIEDSIQLERTKMEQKVSQLNRRLDMERERIEKLGKDTDKTRKAQKHAQEQQDLELRPLAHEYEVADSERQNELADAKWQAELVAEMELRVLALEKSLGVAPDRSRVRRAGGRRRWER